LGLICYQITKLKMLEFLVRLLSKISILFVFANTLVAAPNGVRGAQESTEESRILKSSREYTNLQCEQDTERRAGVSDWTFGLSTTWAAGHVVALLGKFATFSGHDKVAKGGLGLIGLGIFAAGISTVGNTIAAYLYNPENTDPLTCGGTKELDTATDWTGRGVWVPAVIAAGTSIVGGMAAWLIGDCCDLCIGDRDKLTMHDVGKMAASIGFLSYEIMNWVGFGWSVGDKATNGF